MCFTPNSYTFSDTFGPTIAAENIPGTPMDPAEYGAKRSTNTPLDSYNGELSARNQIALINEMSERRRASLDGRTRPSTPVPENNLNANHFANNHNSHNNNNNVTSSREKLDGTNHMNQSFTNNNVTALTTFNAKRPSLSLSVAEIVENRKNSKQDKEVNNL